MFDLKADGVTVRPIAQLGGDTGFGEIFLDDVFVPDHDVIGGVHDGWRAAMSTSSNERGMSLRSPARFLAPAERLVERWKAEPRSRLRRPSRRRVDQGAGVPAAHLRHRHACLPTAASSAPSHRSPRCSGRTSTSRCTRPRSTCEARTRELGQDSWTDGLLFALGGPIYAGTNEIQRNIIAERLLVCLRREASNEDSIWTNSSATSPPSIDAASRRRRRARRRARLGRTATPARAARCGRTLADLGVHGAGGVRRSSTASTRTPSTSWSPPERLGPLGRARSGHRIHCGGTGSARRRRAGAAHWRPAS